MDIYIWARAVVRLNTKEFDIQCPKLLNRKITESKPVSCLRAITSTMLFILS